MTAAEVSRFAAQSYDRTNPWDGRPSGRPVSDVIPGIVESFVRKGAEHGRITEPYTSDADVLERLGLVAADDTLTNAAVELFCRSTPYARIKIAQASSRPTAAASRVSSLPATRPTSALSTTSETARPTLSSTANHL